jgi:hypothetical protein
MALDAHFNGNAASPAAVFLPPPAVSQTPLVPIVAHAPSKPVPAIVTDDALLCGLFPKNAGGALSPLLCAELSAV